MLAISDVPVPDYTIYQTCHQFWSDDAVAYSVDWNWQGSILLVFLFQTIQDDCGSSRIVRIGLYKRNS